MLHLHHLTPLNAAAAAVAPGVPVVAHLHGTELLMLEAIARDPGRWAHGPAWAARLRAWAAAARRLVVAPGGRERAAGLLGVPVRRFVTLANGFDPLVFRPLEVDRRAVWRRALVEAPRGWRPGAGPGSVRYDEQALDAVARGPVIVYVGRFTEVKRLGLLLEAFADARRADGRARLARSSSAAIRASGRASTPPTRSSGSASRACCSRAGTTSPSCPSCSPPPTCSCSRPRARASAR